MEQPQPFRCADSAEARDEPLFGTASFIRRWLLVEQPGAWGADALFESRMPRHIAKELHDRAGAVGARVVMIRRGARMSQDTRRCYFLRTERGRMYQASLNLDRIDDRERDRLLDLGLAEAQMGAQAERRVPDLLERGLLILVAPPPVLEPPLGHGVNLLPVHAFHQVREGDGLRGRGAVGVRMSDRVSELTTTAFDPGRSVRGGRGRRTWR